jgi:hypothetical protein
MSMMMGNSCGLKTGLGVIGRDSTHLPNELTVATNDFVNRYDVISYDNSLDLNLHDFRIAILT